MPQEQRQDRPIDSLKKHNNEFRKKKWGLARAHATSPDALFRPPAARRAGGTLGDGESRWHVDGGTTSLSCSLKNSKPRQCSLSCRSFETLTLKSTSYQVPGEQLGRAAGAGGAQFNSQTF